MATPDEVKLQKGTVAPTQPEQTGSAKAVSLIESLAAGTPSLPKGTTINPQLQQAQAPELLGQPGQAAVTVTGQTPGTGLAAAVPTTAAAPTIAAPGALTAATTAVSNFICTDGTWEIREVQTDLVEIPASQLSYDTRGNFFEFDTDNLYTGIDYHVVLKLTIRGETIVIQDPEKYAFRVV